MSERKELLSISYHSDDDTNMHKIGEIDFGICHYELQNYIKRYRYDGVKDILATLGHLAYEVKNYLYELPPEESDVNCEAKNDNF